MVTAQTRQALADYLAAGDGDARRLADAWSTAAGVFFSVGEYADAYRAAERWKTVLGADGNAAELQDVENLASIAQPLAGAASQTVESSSPRTVPLVKDAAGLRRSPVMINGMAADGVLDTGANISTVTHSMAEKLGLKS